MVSIAVPTFNGRRTVEASIRSALEQDYAPMEIIVSDDASTDGTAEVVRSLGVDVHVNRKRLGPNRNWNRSIELSSGDFVKFLHQDDLLDRRCVSRMVEMFQRYPSAGMVFSRRKVILHHDSPEERAWRDANRNPHWGFATLEEFNPRGVLAEQMLANSFQKNWIGEPVCVMVRRKVLEQLGGFHVHVKQLVDLDLWFRIAATNDVVFIDDELAVYQCSTESLTAWNRRGRLNWLDPLWMLDGLAADDEMVRRFPEVQMKSRHEGRMALRTPFSRRYQAPAVRPLLRYVLHRFASRSSVYGEISPRKPNLSTMASDHARPQ